MGNRRMGLGRMEKLLEAVDRDLDLTNSTLTGPAISGATKLGLAVQTVAAAGGDQGAATQIAATAPVVLVTGADSGKGVKLPSLATAGAGAMVIITNVTAGQTLKVYPATDDQILPLSDNANYVMAASTTSVLFSADGVKWIGFEGAVIAA
jgi:hypothetical protein